MNEDLDLKQDQDLIKFLSAYAVLSKSEQKQIYCKVCFMMWRKSRYRSIVRLAVLVRACSQVPLLMLEDAWYDLNLSIEERALLIAGLLIGLLCMLQLISKVGAG